jgi:hypothetical protein
MYLGLRFVPLILRLSTLLTHCLGICLFNLPSFEPNLSGEKRKTTKRSLNDVFYCLMMLIRACLALQNYHITLI